MSDEGRKDEKGSGKTAADVIAAIRAGNPVKIGIIGDSLSDAKYTSATYKWGGGWPSHEEPNPEWRWWAWWRPRTVTVFDPIDVDCSAFLDDFQPSSGLLSGWAAVASNDLVVHGGGFERAPADAVFVSGGHRLQMKDVNGVITVTVDGVEYVPKVG